VTENDDWWGKVYTEWRNVARADPQFAGHYQPHVPADLGFYDLRLAETRSQQAELARAAGVHGFCYYHYWFSGKRLLERPFDEVLSTGEPDFPFALCWANDPWSRRWDGRNDDLLQSQEYSHDDDVDHIRSLLPALGDSRAIRVDGKPMFLVYRASHLPEPARTCETWRDEVERAGLPGIHLVAVETAWDLGWDATQVGFDAKVLFQPQFGWLITHVDRVANGRRSIPGKEDLQVYDYDVVVDAVRELESVDYPRYESVFPGWDNTARVGDRAVVIDNATPAKYESWLAEAVGRARSEPPDQRLVFINAWNEWAEGCHLEPDVRFGHAYLEATRRALDSVIQPRVAERRRVEFAGATR
jgi:lipopolysaccharide biosynthesis protein